MKFDYRIICWLIWLIGLFSIGVTDLLCYKVFALQHVYNFIIATLYSSIPFGVLALYTKQVCENKEFTSAQKNVRFSGIFGAFVLTIIYAIWATSAPRDDALNPAGLFFIFAYKYIFLGALAGISVCTIKNLFKRQD